MELIAYVGGGITCPACNNRNALLDYSDGKGDFTREYRCRDCGYVIHFDDCIIKEMEMDKPGMGCQTTYHELRKVNPYRY